MGKLSAIEISCFFTMVVLMTICCYVHAVKALKSADTITWQIGAHVSLIIALWFSSRITVTPVYTFVSTMLLHRYTPFILTGLAGLVSVVIIPIAISVGLSRVMRVMSRWRNSMEQHGLSAVVSAESKLTTEYEKDNLCRVLCLDGGGAKGFYTLGVLKEIEGMLGCPLYKRFDLVYGTSTGAIIASLIALGYEVDAIHDLYKKYVPSVMRASNPRDKSEALATLAKAVYGTKTFTDVKTGIGIVATNWMNELPKIFKGNVSQAHGRTGTFIPGFGVCIADAVQASCSAYPFFERKKVTTSTGEDFELIDGGYCANNPTLYAIADAVAALKKEPSDLRVVSVGVGTYPEPKPRGLKMRFAKKYLVSVQLLQKTLEINTKSMNQLRTVMFKDIQTIRISDTFSEPQMATDLMEHDLKKLNILHQRGKDSFALQEPELTAFLM